MQRQVDTPTVLSVHRAFLVQFGRDTRVEDRCMTGRVEHIISGQACRFESLEALLCFLTEVLQETENE